MKTQNAEIFNHDTDVIILHKYNSILHKYNSIELNGWINHLQYIDQEVDKLLNLFSQSIQNKEIPESINILFSRRKESNKQLHYAVSNYINTYSIAIKCDDLQCDIKYFREYERLRKSYQYHLDKYQRFKDYLYDMGLPKN